MRAAAGQRALDLRRKIVHVGCGLLALSFRWLTWQQALLLALAALVFNLVIFPRIGGRALQRPRELERGFSAGMLLYPAAVAALVLAYGPWRGLLVPAMGWSLLAFGDGAASLVGMRWGRRPLPWNPGKSVEGLAAHAIAGGLAASLVGIFVARGTVGGAAITAAAFLAAMASALLESLDSGVDDNLTTACGGALVADAVLVVATLSWALPMPRALVALAACAVLGVAAAALGKLSIPGAAAATLLGTGVAAWGGWGAFAALCAFFVLGVGATSVGRRVKEARGIAEARGGRRGIGNVVANGGMALLLALYAGHGGFSRDGGATACLVALAAALATAAFDTVSSEIGKAYGRTTILVTTLRRVPPGTEGAVSLQGTLAGAAAALVVGAVSLPWMLGGGGLRFLPVVVVAGFAGTTFESLVGAACARPIQNDLLNFANTLAGALVAALLLLAFRHG